MCAQALDWKVSRIGIVLKQADDLVFVQFRLFWESKDLKVQSLIDFKFGLRRINDEWRLFGRSTFV